MRMMTFSLILFASSALPALDKAINQGCNANQKVQPAIVTSSEMPDLARLIPHSMAWMHATADSCVCYCGGQSWSPGSTACMGGYKYVCNARGANGTNCGWDPLKSGSDPMRCDGGEHCK